MDKLIVGNFGYTSNNIGGQTIKTRNLLALYQQKLGNDKVDYLDIDNLNIYIFLLLFKKIFYSKEVVFVPGQKFLKVFFIPIMIICLWKKKRTSLFAVGGWMSKFLARRPILKKYISQIDFLYVESISLVKSLSSLNITNSKVFPNFRFHDFYKQNLDVKSTFDLVFMARITESKGCNLLFNFISKFNSKNANNNLTLSFYGPVDSSYEKSFYHQIKIYKNVNYKGLCKPDEVFDVLNKYDVCVLPTFYEGEGFPGTIIDSYIAGIPIIISDWLNLPEYVEDGRTGLIFSLNDKEGLYKSVMKLYENHELLKSMKYNAKIKSEQYSSDAAWNVISNDI